MRVRLMSAAEDFDAAAAEPWQAEDLVKDLQLDYLWDAMAGGDSFLRQVARAALLQPASDPDVIERRQAAYADAVSHRDVVASLYAIAVDALNLRRGIFMMPVLNHPGIALSQAVKLLTGLAGQLDLLRGLLAGAAGSFRSPAFHELCATVADQLDDAYLARLRGILRELSFPGGLLMSAGVGPGGEVVGQVLRRPNDENRRLLDRTPMRRPYSSFTLPERDESGANALAELRDRSVADVSRAASEAADHVLGFFACLRTELGFLLACLNLDDALRRVGAPICRPNPRATSMAATGLYDPCLALRTGRAPTGNDVDLSGGALLVITGANGGGKSTLLRALGTAQLMLQAGLPAPATALAAPPVGRVFTHWAREEDTELVHGKLDEELERMARIVDDIRLGDLLLCNESFSSTNEAEGSEILLGVTRALVLAGVDVRSVTHLYDFARTVSDDPDLGARFLRAERPDPGRRTFRLTPGPPSPTSFGLDLYDDLFGTQLAERDYPA
ncbi:MAG: hypothetical protein QM713_12365 [Arachnia sp.]